MYILASDLFRKIRIVCRELLLLHNIKNLCGQVENSKWILYSQKAGVKCAY